MAYEANTRITLLRKELNLSQTAFGERLGLSRGVIKNIDEHNAPVKPLLLQQICKEYNVNREWLETGEGEMFNPVDLDVELAGYFGSVLADEQGSFRKDFLTALSKLPPEGWELLEEFIENLIRARQKNEEDGE
jgi:transcriptional regulator with XRE-family HTH domain